MDTLTLLKKLTGVYGVSGSEGAVCDVLHELLDEDVVEWTSDPLGNLTAILKKGTPMVMLDAHMDEIGLIVTALDPEGFVSVSAVGGMDRRLLIGQEVVIHGEREVPGIISSKPPHLLSAEDEKKVPKVEDLWIDTGLSEETLKKTVSLGDRISFKAAFRPLMGTQVSAVKLDNRSGVAALIKAAELLKNMPSAAGVALCFSTREELGTLGAKTASFALQPDLAVSVDVSFAWTPDADRHECGELGKGPMIGLSPVLDDALSKILIALAKEHEIPYQIEVMGGLTSTNADSISVSGRGCRTALLSIPLKYMHTPIEVIDTVDVEKTAALLAEFVRKAGETA